MQSNDSELTLVPIGTDGAPARPCTALSDVANQALAATADFYRRVGHEPPWISYLAVENDQAVGICSFKTPPRDNRVEIAYYTFPENEGRGIATHLAGELVRIARSTDPDIIVTAQTLRAEGPSTTILRKLNFRLVDAFDHPEDGPIWEWQLVVPIK